MPAKPPSPCASFHDQLSSLIDGELATTDRSALEEHLEGCPSCRAELELERTLMRELRALPLETCPPATVSRARAHVREQIDASPAEPASPLVFAKPQPERATRRLGSTWAIAAVVLALLGSAMIALLLTRPDSGPQMELADAAELAQAEDDVRFALAYFSGIAREAGLTLRDEVIAERILEPPRKALAQLSASDGERRPVEKEQP